MNKTLITAVALASMCMWNCKKKTDDPTPVPGTNNPSNKSKTELITAHAWKLQSSTADKDVDIDGDGQSSKDVFSQRPSCFKDNFISLTNSSPKTIFYDEGASKCDTDAKQSTNADWSWNDTETEINIGESFFGVLVPAKKFAIVSVDETTLTIKYTSSDRNKLDYIATDVYVTR